MYIFMYVCIYIYIRGKNIFTCTLWTNIAIFLLVLFILRMVPQVQMLGITSTLNHKQ